MSAPPRSPLHVDECELGECDLGQLWQQLGDETSPLCQRISEIVERLAPDISPYDRRQAVDDIATAIETVIPDAW